MKNVLSAMKYPVTRFKSLALALKELEPFIHNGEHLQTGKPFEKFGGMRSREILANWLLCVAINAVDNRELTFSSDPVGGDGIICDSVTGETWPTEHVMVPRLRPGETGDAEALILKAIEHKRNKGSAACAAGKTLVVFLEAGAGIWFPNKVARQLPDPMLFAAAWVVGLHGNDKFATADDTRTMSTRKSGSHQTLWWREMDSNPRFLARRCRFLLRKANCGDRCNWQL